MSIPDTEPTTQAPCCSSQDTEFHAGPTYGQDGDPAGDGALPMARR